MHRQGYSLKEIANVTKHKNLQSLEHYIGGPNHEDKEGYSPALFNYSKNKENSPVMKHTSEEDKNVTKRMKPNEQNIIMPIDTPQPAVPLSQNVIQNQLRQAANMFQNASFSNCTINFQMPR